MSSLPLSRLQHAIDQYWNATGITCGSLEEDSKLRGMGSGPIEGRHHALLIRGGGLSDGLGFAVAVQEFRELCRHDLCISSEKVG